MQALYLTQKYKNSSKSNSFQFIHPIWWNDAHFISIYPLYVLSLTWSRRQAGEQNRLQLQPLK